jgi:RimJ/RimL family protein N-acetyltransferase
VSDTVLETERLVLRRWRDGDLDLWLEHLNTPQVKAHLGGPQDPEAVAERFARMENAWTKDGFSFLAVDLRETGRFLGTAGIGPISNDRAPEALRDMVQIGWQLRRDYWGRGYATEAAREVLAWAFDGLNLPVVYAQTSESNPASWRIMEKLGMERLSALDYDAPDYPPEDNPTKVYGLTREAWLSRAEAVAHA